MNTPQFKKFQHDMNTMREERIQNQTETIWNHIMGRFIPYTKANADKDAAWKHDD